MIDKTKDIHYNYLFAAHPNQEETNHGKRS